VSKERRQSRLQKKHAGTQKGPMSAPALRDVVLNPEWIPHTYDAAGENLTFVDVPRRAHAELTFLSDEDFAGRFAKAIFPAASVALETENAERAPIHFVFHTSFCGSTLLARALDIPGVSTALREPDILINLANRLVRSDDGSNRQRVEVVLRLLERPFAPGERVIVKPTNFANRLLEPLLTMRPSSRAVLLYSDVETFLRSLLKRGMFGRIFGRRMFAQLSGWSPLSFGYGTAELLQQTDVQIAALAWLMQVHHFDSIARAFSERAIVVDSATLAASPADVIEQAQSLFGLGLGRRQVEEIASGPVFSKHSKFSDRDYDSAARDEEHRAASEAHAEELNMVVQWIEAVARQTGTPLRPGS
jgi:hypothetical protein